MDPEIFDRLARSLTAAGPRRAAIGRLTAVLAGMGWAPIAAESTTNGLRHRRRMRHRHNHDNRKGKRARRKPKQRRDDPPLVDCTQQGTQGQPCARSASNELLRCCNGVCPTSPTCVSAGRWTSVSCQSIQECQATADQCCTRETFCDDEEALCFCASSEFGDLCSLDRDCDIEKVCVCGRCQ